MTQGSVHPRLAHLLALTTENDAALARSLGISQPTMWRLRNGRIRKQGRYIDLLEAHLTAKLPTEAEAVFVELRLLAGRNPALLDLLRDLVGAIRFHSDLGQASGRG